MEWKENPQLADRMLALIAEDMKIDKPLPHVTELIYCLTRSWNDRFDYIPLAPKEVCLFSIGVGLGEYLLSPHREEVGGELDGINYSIDFMTLGEEGGIAPDQLGELKSTRMSTKKHPDDFPETWKKQLLAYMKGAGSLHAIYAVMYVIPAEFKTWEVTATQQEVDDNWTWMQSRNVIYQDFIQQGIPPTPFEFNEVWECKSCRYKLGCDLAVSIQKEQETGDENQDRD